MKLRFATSKAKFDINYNKLGILIDLPFFARLKTLVLRKLGNTSKISHLEGSIAQRLSPLHEPIPGNSSERAQKSKSQSPLAVSNDAGLPYPAQNILLGIVRDPGQKYQEKKLFNRNLECLADRNL